jgi:hypothetical protein
MTLNKKIKRFMALADAHNASIRDSFISTLKRRADECLTYSLEFKIESAFIGCFADNTFHLYSGKVKDKFKKMSLSEYESELTEKWTNAQRLYTDLCSWIDDYIDRCMKNKKALNTFYEKGELPLFIVLTSLFKGDNHYCMAYEFFDTETDGVYRANVFDSKGKCAVDKDIDYRFFEVRPMTKYEFEHIYLMDRLQTKGFTCEKEAIEFDNYLRRLFNAQDRL